MKDEKELKGVRKRAWGRWVAEIRIPSNRTRLWLGSFDNPVKAARAYDAASLCINGPWTNKEFNFPDERIYWPYIPEQQRRFLSQIDIKTIATRYACHLATIAPLPPLRSSPPPDVPPTVLASDLKKSEEIEVHFDDELSGFSSDTFLLKNMNAMEEMLKSWEAKRWKELVSIF